MRSDGITVRPLREITGDARTTLANERVALGTGSSLGDGVERLLALAADHDGDRDRLGALVAQGLAVSLVDLRATLRQLDGGGPASRCCAPSSANAFSVCRGRDADGLRPGRHPAGRRRADADRAVPRDQPRLRVESAGTGRSARRLLAGALRASVTATGNLLSGKAVGAATAYRILKNVEHVIVTAGTGVPTSGLVLST
jgi:hypothetical protein